MFTDQSGNAGDKDVGHVGPARFAVVFEFACGRLVEQCGVCLVLVSGSCRLDLPVFGGYSFAP